MSSTQHSQRPYHESNPRPSDVRSAKTLSTFLTQPGPAPPHRGSTIAQDTSRNYGTQPEPRNDSQSQGGYNHGDGSYRRHDTGSHMPYHQPVVSISRRYHSNPTLSLDHTDSQNTQNTSYQRHPSLSLDTRNLPNSRPSPCTPSLPAPHSPSSDLPSPLHADLTSLKSGLESLWNLSSKKLHVLHSTVTAQTDTLRSLSLTNANLDSTITQQQAALSQEIERLGAENRRLIKEARDAEEGRVKALREREMLNDANARLWEDKARLEGEKRELRVKLDAETDFARLCQRELEKAKEKSHSDQNVKVKREDDDDERANDGLPEVRVPLVRVEELIASRLHYQANEFNRAADELYLKLAQSQTRVAELEAQFKRYSANINTVGTAPHPPPPPPPPQPHPSSGKTANSTRPEKSTPAVTPVTPHTSLVKIVNDPAPSIPSSVSENGREFPFVKPWGDSNKKILETGYRLSGMNMRHGETREQPTPPDPGGTRDVHLIHRTGSGGSGPGHRPMESRSVERDMGPSLRRMSVPTHSSRSTSYSNSPVMDPLRIGKRAAPRPEPATSEDAPRRQQVVSAYTGVGAGAGWKPAPGLPPTSTTSARSSLSHSQRSTSHSLSATPDRPIKRARTTDPGPQDGINKHEEESSKASNAPGDVDVEMTSTSDTTGTTPPEQPPSTTSSQTKTTRMEPPLAPPENPHHSGQEMTGEERLMFTSLGRVLVPKRDNDGWKCVLCRQERKSPTATFGESTPIGVVTQHVKGTHRQFWNDLGGSNKQNVAPGS